MLQSIAFMSSLSLFCVLPWILFNYSFIINTSFWINWFILRSFPSSFPGPIFFFFASMLTFPCHPVPSLHSFTRTLLSLSHRLLFTHFRHFLFSTQSALFYRFPRASLFFIVYMLSILLSPFSSFTFVSSCIIVLAIIFG